MTQNNKVQAGSDPRAASALPAVDDRVPGEHRILIACMPKSGSTFLAKTLESIPGMRRARLVPGHQRREQELCIARLNAEIRQSELRVVKGPLPYRGFVAQHHLRYSEPTEHILHQFRLTPVVLVRNLFDIVVSMRDHLLDTAPYMSMAYVSQEMRTWPEAQMHRFLADMMMPWYINFYRSWHDCPNLLMVNYEELMEDKAGVLRRICDHVAMEVSEADILAALDAQPKGGTRLNKGVSGRGESLAPEVKDHIRRLASYYTDLDFTRLGL